MTSIRSHAPVDTAGHWARRIIALGLKVARVGLGEVRMQPSQVLGRTLSGNLPRFAFNRTRTALLRALGVRIGKRSLVLGLLDITGPGDATQVSIGDDTCITGPLYIDLGAPVRIGNGVQLGHHVTLLTLDHEISVPDHRCGRLMSGPIVIGDGAWIGSRVTILPGISIGAGAVVATGAVVVSDVAANTLVAGVPARVLRELGDRPMATSKARRLSPVNPPYEAR